MKRRTKEDGYIDLIGAVVYRAVADLRIKTQELDAAEFLFTNRIGRFLNKYQFDSHIDIDFIRKVATHACSRKILEKYGLKKDREIDVSKYFARSV